MSLELVKVPQSNTVDYLSESDLRIGIRNVGPMSVLLEEITLGFHRAHPSVSEKDVSIRHACDARLRASGALDYERIPIRASLLFLPWTNVFSITVKYREDTTAGLGSLRTDVIGESFLIFRDPPNFPGKVRIPASIFVSFKDSEDLELALMVEMLLRRAGFTPYLARNDQRTGSDYWEAKIEPAIRDAEGILVIWTPFTHRHPGPVVRELTYSQQVGTPVGLFLEAGTQLPDEYPPDEKEYGGPFHREGAFAEFAKEIEACAYHWRQGHGFF